jgi:archaellum biogenesis ATPase FlaH
MTENSVLSHPVFQNRAFFPTNPDKTPKVLHWKKDALPAEKAVKSWLGEEHWAMPTGNGLLVIDVDTKNGGSEEEVYKLGFPRGTFRVETPSGGCHLYYKDIGLNLKNSVQRLGKGIDVRSDGGYVCIPPMKGYKITCDHDPKTVLPPDLKLPIQAEPDVVYDFDADIEGGFYAEGTRNTSLFHVGSSMRARGIPEEGIHAALSALNKKRCNPPLPQSEVDRIVESVRGFQQGTVQGGPEARLRIQTAAFIEERDGEATQSFIWREHILDKMPNLLYAEGGMGKTTLCLMIVEELMKKEPEAKILWLPVENNMESTRIQMKSFDIDMNRFLVLERSTGGYSMDFAQEADLIEFGKLVTMNKPRLVIIDSLSSMSSADINSNAIRAVMKNVQDVVCEQNRASLIYIHHENKSDMATARNKSMGSNMILAQVRMALRLTVGAESNARILTAEKFNLNMPAPLQITSLAEGEYEVEAVKLVGGDKDVSSRVRHRLQDLFSAELKMPMKDVFKALEIEDDIMIPEDITMEGMIAVAKSLNIRYLDDDGVKSWHVRRLLKAPEAK